jgi:hypothetical protein
MNIKARIFIPLCALAQMAVAYPAMAVPQEQRNCQLTAEVYTSAMMDTAYRLNMPPEKYDAKTKEEKADFDRKLTSAVDTCSHRYNWNDDEYQHIFLFTVNGLSWLGAIARLKAAGVDEKPLSVAIANLTNADWAAWESADKSVKKSFADKFSLSLHAILIKQGFETNPTKNGYSKKIDEIVNYYFLYSGWLRESNIWLDLPVVKKAALPTGESDADKKWEELVRSAQSSNHLSIEKWNSISSQNWDINKCFIAKEAWNYNSTAKLAAIDAKKTVPPATSQADRQFVYDFVDEVIAFQYQISDFLKECDDAHPNWRTQ